jgi:hypothetical protein
VCVRRTKLWWAFLGSYHMHGHWRGDGRTYQIRTNLVRSEKSFVVIPIGSTTSENLNEHFRKSTKGDDDVMKKENADTNHPTTVTRKHKQTLSNNTIRYNTIQYNTIVL